jgi:tRNA nucleotidyltransferase (CCA-adding enzyme)
LPELDALRYVEQGKKHHPEGNVFKHTILALDAVPIDERTRELMFAILAHDVGKAVVKPVDLGNDHIGFTGHAEEGVSIAETMLRRLTDESALLDTVLPLVRHHMAPYSLKHNLRKKTIRRLALKVDVPLLMALHRADKLGRGSSTDVDLSYIDRILDVYTEVQDEIYPLVQGRHLIKYFGLEPGPHFGAILKQVFEAQLDGRFSTLADGIIYTGEVIGESI